MAKQSVDRLVEQNGMTIAEIALRSGLSEERVEAIVDGRWLSSPEERAMMAVGLGCEVDDVDWGHTLSPRNLRYRQIGLREDFTSE